MRDAGGLAVTSLSFCARIGSPDDTWGHTHTHTHTQYKQELWFEALGKLANACSPFQNIIKRTRLEQAQVLRTLSPDEAVQCILCVYLYSEKYLYSGSVVRQVRRRVPNVLFASWEVFPVEWLESTLIITFINFSLSTLVQEATQIEMELFCLPSSVCPFPIHGHTDLLTIRWKSPPLCVCLGEGGFLVQRFILI